MTEPRKPVIFRYVDPATGVHMISAFPEDNTPFQDVTPLASRTRFITVIECFSNLLLLFCRELGEEVLADQLQQTGLDWEHFVANTIPIMDPADFTKCTDPALQGIIDTLEQQTEDFRVQLNALSVERPNVTRRIQIEMEKRRKNEDSEY